MWLVFLILALIATLILVVHLGVEMNRIDKSVSDLADLLREHYGR